MKANSLRVAAGCVCVVLFAALVAAALAQNPQVRGPGIAPRGPGNGNNSGNGNANGRDRDDNNGGGNKAPPTPALPDDSRLLNLHKKFVEDAEKLAQEYEGKRQTDKAAAVYGEILKLVPAYQKARGALEKIRQEEKVANTRTVTIEANEWWQDTGVRVIAGKPVHIMADGVWTLHMTQRTGPGGLDMASLPKGCKLGSLIGVIVKPGVARPSSEDTAEMKPFAIGNETQFTAERSGALWVAMCAANHKDNTGQIRVQITGRFELEKADK